MPKNKLTLGAWTLLFLALVTVARAGVPEAKAAYTRGLALEKSKQYAQAIQEYEAALAAEPRYVYANKQLGNCYYFQGDKAAALKQYDTYLAAVPGDLAVKGVADGLRAAGGASANSAKVGETASAEDHKKNNALYTNIAFLGLGIYNLGYSRAFGDHNSLRVEGVIWGQNIGTIKTSLTGLGVGWHFTTKRLAGWYIGPKLNYYALTATDSLVSSTLTPYTVEAKGSVMAIGGEFGYQWLWDSGFLINFGLGAQQASANATVTVSDPTIKSTSTAGTFSGLLPILNLNVGWAF